MNADRRAVGERIAMGVYRLVLRCFPQDFRRAYATDALDVFLSLYRDAVATRGMPGGALFLATAAVRGVTGGLAERWSRWRNPVEPRGARVSAGAALGFLWQDVRFAIRSYRRQPGFSVVAVAILALGIGASTTIFSVVDVVLLRGLPYPQADRLVYFDEGSHTGPDFADWQERLPAFDEMAAVAAASRDLTNEGPPTRVAAALTTGNLFTMLGARAAVGRVLTPGEEASPGKVAVLSYQFWASRWGGDSSVVGRSLLLNGEPYEIVGVLHPSFLPPNPLLRRAGADLWIPLDQALPWLTLRTRYSLNVIGRLRDGVEIGAARAQMAAWETWAQQEFPEQYTSASGWKRQVPLVPLQHAVVRSVSTALYLLLGAVGLMLLIACANVANLFLARGTDRERELALRAALGAGRGRIALQLLTESVLLGVTGGLLGSGLAVAGVRAFTSLSPGGVPRLDEVTVDIRMLLFAFGLSFITGIVFGLAPAAYAARTDVNEALKDASGKASAGRGRIRLKNALVVAELAIALVLLIGAGLLFGSLVRLTRVDTGFHAESVLVMPLTLGTGYETPGRRAQFVRNLNDRLRVIPGVTEAAAGATLPFSAGGRCCWRSRIRTRADAAERDSVLALLRPVTPEYFDLLGVPILQGRALRWDDPTEGNTVTVITRDLAERFFPGRSPLGERFNVGRAEPVDLTVVGVISDLKHWSLSTDDDIDIYLPYGYLADDLDLVSIGVRTETGADLIVPLLREAVWGMDGQLPIPEITPLPTLVSQTIASERFLSTLLATFSVIAVMLAAGGIYGTMLYSVGQRHQEFGIRMALGATGSQLLRFVVRQGLVLTVTGVAIGVVGALVASRVMESFVYGLTTTDPATFVTVAVLLTTVACLACYVPARRAARTDPMTTLRGE